MLAMLRAVSEVPVMVITARDDDVQVVRLLTQGADDYVVKPFGADQLDARIRAVLRRVARRTPGRSWSAVWWWTPPPAPPRWTVSR